MARDVLREVLDEELLVDHDLVDGLLEDLGEARHVHALLGRVEVDEAVDLGGDERVAAAVLHAHGFLDAGHAGAREADSDLGRDACRSDAEVSLSCCTDQPYQGGKWPKKSASPRSSRSPPTI